MKIKQSASKLPVGMEDYPPALRRQILKKRKPKPTRIEDKVFSCLPRIYDQTSSCLYQLYDKTYSIITYPLKVIKTAMVNHPYSTIGGVILYAHAYYELSNLGTGVAASTVRVSNAVMSLGLGTFFLAKQFIQP